MSRKKKYDVSGLPEAQFEQGSRRGVLKNLLHVKSTTEMDRTEALALKQAEDACFRTYDKNYRFTSKDICNIHKLWLGKIYSWAGHYRQVNISKGSFNFAAAAHIPQLMQEFEKSLLSRFTPCNFEGRNFIVQALAEVHVEFILIHPFREGNGRVARLLATIMALQADLPPLDFTIVKGKKKQEYFSAVRTGLKRDYKPMERIFSEILEKTTSHL